MLGESRVRAEQDDGGGQDRLEQGHGTLDRKSDAQDAGSQSHIPELGQLKIRDQPSHDT